MASHNPWQHEDFHLEEYYGWVLTLPAGDLRRNSVIKGLFPGEAGSRKQQELEQLESKGNAKHNDALLVYIRPNGAASFVKFLEVLGMQGYTMQAERFARLLVPAPTTQSSPLRLAEMQTQEDGTHGAGSIAPGHTHEQQSRSGAGRETSGTADAVIGSALSNVNMIIMYGGYQDVIHRGQSVLYSLKRQFGWSREEEIPGSASIQDREYAVESGPTGSSPQRRKRVEHDEEHETCASERVESVDVSGTGIPGLPASPADLSLAAAAAAAAAVAAAAAAAAAMSMSPLDVDTSPLSGGSQSAAPVANSSDRVNLSPAVSDSPTGAKKRLKELDNPETEEEAEVSVRRILRTSAGTIYLHPDCAKDSTFVDDLLMEQGFDHNQFKIAARATRPSYATNRELTENILVSVLVRANSDGYYYPFVKETLEEMLQAIFNEKNIRIKFDRRKHSVFLIVSMGAQSVLRLYKYAIYTPGFLAGLGVQRVQALGQLTAFVISPQDAQETQETTLAIVEENDQLKLLRDDLGADSLIPHECSDGCSQYQLLKECAKKAFGNEDQMQKLVRNLTSHFEELRPVDTLPIPSMQGSATPASGTPISPTPHPMSHAGWSTKQLSSSTPLPSESEKKQLSSSTPLPSESESTLQALLSSMLKMDDRALDSFISSCLQVSELTAAVLKKRLEVELLDLGNLGTGTKLKVDPDSAVLHGKSTEELVLPSRGDLPSQSVPMPVTGVSAKQAEHIDDPWLDRRFSAHYPFLIERLQPLETRMQAFAKGIITMGTKRYLMSIERPSKHNKVFFDEIMRGGAESFQGFLDVLDELGYDFVDVREELKRLLPGRAAATSSTGTYVAVAGRVGSGVVAGGMERSMATPPWSVSSGLEPPPSAVAGAAAAAESSSRRLVDVVDLGGLSVALGDALVDSARQNLGKRAVCAAGGRLNDAAAILNEFLYSHGDEIEGRCEIRNVHLILKYLTINKPDLTLRDLEELLTHKTVAPQSARTFREMLSSCDLWED